MVERRRGRSLRRNTYVTRANVTLVFPYLTVHLNEARFVLLGLILVIVFRVRWCCDRFVWSPPAIQLAIALFELPDSSLGFIKLVWLLYARVIIWGAKSNSLFVCLFIHRWFVWKGKSVNKCVRKTDLVHGLACYFHLNNFYLLSVYLCALPSYFGASSNAHSLFILYSLKLT